MQTEASDWDTARGANLEIERGLAVSPAAPDLSEILCVRHSVAERSLYSSQDEYDEGPRAGAAGEPGGIGPVGDWAADTGTI